MKILHKLLPYLAILAFGVAVFLVWRSVREYGLAGLVEALRQIPPERLLLAGLCAAGSYLMLTLFDVLAVRASGHALPYPRVALASFVALSIGHSLGLAPLGSGALRARYYTRWGLDAETIARVIVHTTVTVTLGQIALAGVVLLVEPGPVAAWTHLGDAAVRLCGVLCLAAISGYVVAAKFLRRPVRIRGWSFKLPRWRIALGQVLVGAGNFAFLTGALHLVLATANPQPFWTTAAIYVLASVAALISHVPGGLGVIEFVVLAFLPNAGAFAALIAYRVLYYIVPLAIGGALLGATELADRQAARTAAARSGA
jgi:glycosyltransferase 2 family protein